MPGIVEKIRVALDGAKREIGPVSAGSEVVGRPNTGTLPNDRLLGIRL
jgi:hypothetical protein